MCSESDGGSSDGESSNMEGLIERKFQEIIRKTQLQIAGMSHDCAKLEEISFIRDNGISQVFLC